MELETKVKEILNNLNINIKLKGYRCWVEAIKYVIENNKINYSLTKEIYSYIAEKTDSTVSAIDGALRHAHINNKEEIQKYFGVTYKIDNSTLLALIVNKVKTEM